MITLSSGMTGSKSASDMFAQAKASLATTTFLPRHGASTRLAIGPARLLEKFYHRNAQRLMPGLPGD